MELDGLENFRIPAEFADYRRRLIIHAEREVIRIESPRLFNELMKYGALPVPKMQFEVGNKAFEVYYLANEQFTVAEVIANLRRGFPRLKFQHDTLMRMSQLAVNDRLYPKQWAPHKIEAKTAWERVAEVQPPLARVKIAIVDSGIKEDHEHFAGVTISGLSIIPPFDGTFADNTGHGTMLAGIIGATHNEAGVAGVARNFEILVFKITDERTPPTALAAVSGIAAAAARQAKVINASWHVLDVGEALHDAIEAAGLDDCLVVIAAGNYGSNNTENPTLPASYDDLDNTIVAMASDRNDHKCWFSNYGDNVDLAAPGVDVLTTGIFYVHPRYPRFTGTSASAAHVSAAAALLLAIDQWTPQDIRTHLNESADKSHVLWSTCRSEGRLSLRRACSPFTIVAPAGGEEFRRESEFDVRWTLDYESSIVENVEISFINSETRTTMGLQFDAVAGALARRVKVPKEAVQAFIRVKCKERNLYTDSGVFRIT